MGRGHLIKLHREWGSAANWGANEQLCAGFIPHMREGRNFVANVTNSFLLLRSHLSKNTQTT
jgi:hypothetical protein